MTRNTHKRIGIFAGVFSLCISMGISSAYAAAANATVGAVIFGSLTSSTVLTLTFGDLNSGPIPGTVVIAANGIRSATGGVNLGGGSASSPATFSLIGTPSSTYAITLPSSVTISDFGANYMVVDNFTSFPIGTGLLDAGGSQTLTIGGTLNVLANQTMGNYFGIMSITIVYN